MSTLDWDRVKHVLADRYRIRELVGEGGMAFVYLADDLKHERSVALKVLRPELAEIVGSERFLSEIRTTATLQHPNICPLYDSGEADGFLYYVMPFVEGETLHDRLEREGPLPVDEAVDIAAILAEALDYAHRQGVVHRDVKPRNVLLQDRKPVLADFGIALAVEGTAEDRLTRTQAIVGTWGYMSPEQASGEQKLGPRADIYALGCVLYEMLAGEPPFSGKTPQAILSRVVTEDADPVSTHRASTPPNVDAVVKRALQRVPADRFASAQRMAEALRDPGFGLSEARAASSTTSRWLAYSGWLVAVLALLSAFMASRTDAPAESPARFASPFTEGQEPASYIYQSFILSRDGSSLVYTGPGDQLWLRRWAVLDAQPIPGTEGGDSPHLSEDGRQLLFRREGGAYLINLDGGPARQLVSGHTEGNVWPRWGEDGHIYFRDLSFGVARIPVGGGTPESMTTIGAGETSHMAWSFTPDGRFALIHLNLEDGTWGSSVLDLRSGDRRTLTDAGVPTWLESGHVVVMTRDGVVLAAPDDVLTDPSSSTFAPVLDGVRIAYPSRSGDLVFTASGSIRYAQLQLVSRSGSAQPIGRAVGISGTVSFGWDLSPDGRRIALQMQAYPNRSDIWTYELPSGPFSRMTLSPLDDRIPFWSADGRSISYVNGPSGSRYLWSLDAIGDPAPRQIVHSDHSWVKGSWAPDGTSLLLQTAPNSPATPGGRDIWLTRPSEDETLVPLLTEPYDEISASISPDGHWMAYVSNETGTDEVYVRPFPAIDSGKWRISLEGGIGPIWSQAGSELFYVDAQRSLIAAVYTADATFEVDDRNVLFTLPDNFIVGRVGSFYDVSPDGQQFLMAEETVGGPLIYVSNWSEELKRLVPN